MSIKDLKRRIYVHIFEEQPLNDSTIAKILKTHSQNLKESGDLSFPSDLEIWLHRVVATKNQINNDKFTRNCLSLTKESEEWPIPIEKIIIQNDRYVLHLNKFIAMKHIFNDVLENPLYAKFQMKHTFRITFDNELTEDLSIWRSKLIALTINNILNFCSQVEIDSQNECDININFISNGSNDHNIQKNIIIHCGIVTNGSKKKTNLSYENYFCLRRTDMQLMAMHKYGIRVQDNTYFTQFLDKLGKAAVTIDLLEVKHSSPVQIVEGSRGSSKGASFILYNCARLETLLETFTDRVKDNFYSELPSLKEIDLTNLKEDEEWQLVYNYILSFPDVIARVLLNLENGQSAPHLIPQFLSGLVSLFSVYYRRIKILVDNRSHLLAVLFARIYLLKCLQKILKICLGFLDIEPIKKM